MHISPRLTPRNKGLLGALLFALSAYFAWLSSAASNMTSPMCPTDRRKVVVISDMQACGDDGIGVLLLAKDKCISLRAAIGTSGNIWANEATLNLARLLKRIKSDAKAYVGLPIQFHTERISRFRKERSSRSSFVTYPGALAKLSSYSPPTTSASLIAKESGIDYLTRTLVSEAQPVTLCVFGPPTILWEALHRAPELNRLIANVFMMGGAVHIQGNATEFAEFNFWFDPVAANGVLGSGLPITLIALDATDPISYPSDVLYRGNPQSAAYQYVQHCLKERHRRTRAPIRMWDEVVAAVTLSESVISESITSAAEVETSAGPRYGALRLVNDTDSRRPKLRIVLAVRPAAVTAAIRDAVDLGDEGREADEP
ncbi:MAG: nucleoside hydrolase [Chthoniobacterales bacterium]